MNWDAIGAIGEIVGALSVVVTVLYLARQAKVSGEATVSAARSASAIAMSELDRDTARDPELARMLHQSFQTEMHDYDEIEWLRFTTMARSVTGLIEEQYIQSLRGTTDSEQAEIQLAAMIGMIEYPAWQQFWKREVSAGGWRRAFIDAVNNKRTGKTYPADVIAGKMAGATSHDRS